MAYLDSFTNIEAYSNQVEIPEIASVIHEDVFNQATYGNHCELSATKILAVYNDVTNSKGMVRIGTRVSDYAIEWGTAVEFYNGACKYLIPVRISDSKFAIVYVQGSDDDGYIRCGTVSGTVPTLGTPKEFKDASTTIPIGAILWDTEKICIAYANGTTNGQCIICDTTDINSVTLGAEATFIATTDITGYTNLTQLCKHSATLSSVVYRVSATVTEVVTLSLSGTTITVNTAGKAAFGGTADIRYPSIGALSATAFALAYTDVTDTNKGNTQIGTISGTTITAGASEYTFDTTNHALRLPTILPISSTLCIVVFNEGASYNYFTLMSISGTVATMLRSNVAFGDGQQFGYQLGKGDSMIMVTLTSSRVITFSCLSYYYNKFMCGMLYLERDTSGLRVSPRSMLYKVASAITGEQIEIASLYINSVNAFSMDTRFIIAHNGTSVEKYMYNSGEGDIFTPTGYGDTVTERGTRYSIIMPLANNPIILKENEELYVGTNSIQAATCTVFGLKRS